MDDKIHQRCDSHNNNNNINNNNNNSNFDDDDDDDTATSTCYETTTPATQSSAAASTGEVVPSADENATSFLTSISSLQHPSAFPVAPTITTTTTTTTTQLASLTAAASATAALLKNVDARLTSETTEVCELFRTSPNNLSERVLGPPKRDKLRTSRSFDSPGSVLQHQQQQQQYHQQQHQQQQQQHNNNNNNNFQQQQQQQHNNNNNNNFQQQQQLRQLESVRREARNVYTSTTAFADDIPATVVDNNYNDDIVANDNNYNNINNNNNIGNNPDRRAEDKFKEKYSLATTVKDKEENDNKDSLESLMPGDMPINYCYIKPTGSHVGARDSRRSNRLSSAMLTTSSSFSSAEESLAAFLDPLRIRSGLREEELWHRRRSDVGSGNRRVERAVRVSFIITLVGLMAGTIITVFGFVRVEGWSEQKQLAFQILGPTCLVSTLAVWTVGALFWYLWRSEWTREKQAMELKSRVHLHAIAMDLLKKSSPNLDSPLSSIVSSNLLLQASGADRRLRRKLLAKLRQQETLEFSSNENSRRSSRALSVDSRLQRHSSCNATNAAASSDGRRRSPYSGSTKGNGSTSTRSKRRILIPAGFDLPGIKISRFETIDVEDSEENKTLKLLVEGARRKKKDSAVSTGSANSASNSKTSRSHHRHHYCGSSSSFSRRYIVVRSSDASSDYSRLSEYSLTGSRNGSHSRSSRSSRDSSVLSGSQRLFFDLTSPYASQWDVEDDEVAASDVVVTSYDALLKGTKGHGNSHKTGETGGRNYTLLTPSIPRKNSIVTFDISEPSVRRHSSPVASLKRKDSTSVVNATTAVAEPDGDDQKQHHNTGQHHHHRNHPRVQRVPSSCSSKRHLLPVAPFGKMAPRRRSCEKSLPLISITRETSSPTQNLSERLDGKTGIEAIEDSSV